MQIGKIRLTKKIYSSKKKSKLFYMEGPKSCSYLFKVLPLWECPSMWIPYIYAIKCVFLLLKRNNFHYHKETKQAK